MAKNEIAVPNGNETYLALSDFNLSDAMADEMNGLSATFERVKIPIGGGTVFEFPGENADEVESVKEINAVILYHHPLNAYYATKYNGGSNPPDWNCRHWQPRRELQKLPLQCIRLRRKRLQGLQKSPPSVSLTRGRRIPHDLIPSDRLFERFYTLSYEDIAKV